jgi:hypothetical protein
MAALATISNKEGLIPKVCVARDEQVGVYGFVFHRGTLRDMRELENAADVAQMASGSPRSLTISYT